MASIEKEQRGKVNTAVSSSNFKPPLQNYAPNNIQDRSTENSRLTNDNKKKSSTHENKYHEAYLLRLLLKYGHFEISVDDPNLDAESNQSVQRPKK